MAHRAWNKVVYGGRQPGFPDNHTHSSFLEEMVMNANVVRRDLWTTVLDSVGVAQYLSVVAIIASVWVYILLRHLPPAALLTLDALLLGIGLSIWLIIRHPTTTTATPVTTSLRNLLYFVAGLYVMTPVFHTLTTSISSDSIWACTVCLMLLHLFLHDYSCCSGGAPSSVTANISLHASVVASVLIASRLPSRPLVFATMLFSLEFFLLFPALSCSIKRRSVALHLTVSSLLHLTALSLLVPLSVPACLAHAAALLLISAGCPLWLLRIQQYKFEINGPWDEAKLCFHVDEDK